MEEIWGGGEEDNGLNHPTESPSNEPIFSGCPQMGSVCIMSAAASMK